MSRIVKFAIVLAGYAAALLAAWAAFEVRVLTEGPEAEAAGGMYAFGDAVLFLGVFGFLALFPTGLGLYFLRPTARR